VQGATRKVVPATYDPALGCATCLAPAWPPAIAVAKAVATAAAAAAAAAAEAEEGAEAEAAPELDLTDAGDAIVEVSLNGQQYTTDCKHFAFVGEPNVSACEPAGGAIEGGGSVKVLARYVSDTGVLRARLTKLDAPVEEGATPEMPAGDAICLDVEATVSDAPTDHSLAR